MNKLNKIREDKKDSLDSIRELVLSKALDILNEGGRDALTTRALAEEAGLQPHDLYRLFIDKKGLIEALVEHGFLKYLREKDSQREQGDPIEDLRNGWDLHIEFGLANPVLYSLMYGEPRAGHMNPAAARAKNVLHRKIHRIALAGRLRLPVDTAVDLVHSSACGVVLTLLTKAKNEQDMNISRTARDSVLGLIATEMVMELSNTKMGAANALLSRLDELVQFSESERGLLGEWLGRISNPSVS